MLPIVKNFDTLLRGQMYDLISYIVRGKARLSILKALDKPMTPTQIASQLKNHRSTISRSLLNMEKKGIVKCLTPKEKTGRLYALTKRGKQVLKKIGK